MTRVSCPDCRLRFTPTAEACLSACPICELPLRALDRPDLAIGYQLFRPADIESSLPEAVAVAMPVPDPSR